MAKRSEILLKVILLTSAQLCGIAFAHANAKDTLDLWLFSAREEVLRINYGFEDLEAPLLKRGCTLDSLLFENPVRKKRKWQQLWQEKQMIDRQLQSIEAEKELQLLKIRYKKGIDLIKLLYEKILALDHHFTGMQTYQNVLLLSNPNTYPDFQKTKAIGILYG